MDKLITAFGNRVLSHDRGRRNEYSLIVAFEGLGEICTYIHKSMGLPLILAFVCGDYGNTGLQLHNPEDYVINYVFADRNGGEILVVKALVDSNRMEIPSIGVEIPTASFYEREIKDLYGIKPMGHPDPKRLVFHSNWPEGVHPLRRDYKRDNKPPMAQEEIRFQKILGDGVYEIPVGPVHAGIIEPGHFRFSVAGEPIINLEAQLYFVHKGIEKLSEGQSLEKTFYISERISGDETFSNSLTFCQAVEKMAGVDIPERAQYIRVIFAEVERLISHLGDLAGICLDTAYGFAAYQFRMLRGWAYLVADELCGMRFLRSVNRLGGVRRDFIAGKERSVLKQLDAIRKELNDTAGIIRANSMFIDRVENTGVLTKQIAEDLNATGPGGRASGIDYDVRKSFPYECYSKLDFNVPVYQYGDVNCRMNVKIEECLSSIELIRQGIECMPPGEIHRDLLGIEPYSSAFGITEGARGENIHFVMVGEKEKILRYKIRTPSFCNWPALCQAVKGNIVPDFPLINKSFNLSYAGNDL